jgi:quercetin dioxygenase-like cupin family protein
MKNHRQLTIRILTLSGGASILGALLVFAAVFARAQGQTSEHAATPTGHEATTTGKVVAEDHTDMQNTRVRFEPGARTYWHSHAGGQVLVVQEGRGRMQEEGGPIREMAPGDAIFTQPGVAHWHGAAPDHYVVLLSAYIGTVNWKQPVTEDEYLGKQKK